MGKVEVGKTYKTLRGWDAVVVGQRPDGMFIGYYTTPKTSHTQTCTWSLEGHLYTFSGWMQHASGSLVIPEPKKTYIPWEQVGNKYNFYARDYDGLGYFYSSKPSCVDHYWYGEEGANDDLLEGIVRGDEEAKDSLIVRPGYKA